MSEVRFLLRERKDPRICKHDGVLYCSDCGSDVQFLPVPAAPSRCAYEYTHEGADGVRCKIRCNVLKIDHPETLGVADQIHAFVPPAPHTTYCRLDADHRGMCCGVPGSVCECGTASGTASLAPTKEETEERLCSVCGGRWLDHYDKDHFFYAAPSTAPAPPKEREKVDANGVPFRNTHDAMGYLKPPASPAPTTEKERATAVTDFVVCPRCWNAGSVPISDQAAKDRDRVKELIALLGHGGSVTPFQGMTLRDWYAGMALQGLLARPAPAELVIDGQRMGYDKAAWALAQAMIDGRPKP